MKIARSLFVAVLVAASLVSSAFAELPGSPQRIESFALDDHLGTRHAFTDWKDKVGIVVVFLGTECPLARQYTTRIQDLANRYADRGVHFVGINSNRQDSLAEITTEVNRSKIEFAMLKDPGNRVADLFGATRTPEAFLVKPDGTIFYRGRIDDQYGVGYARPDAEERYLRSAIEDLLAGREARLSETKPIGCLIGRVPGREPSGSITFSNQIVRILQKRCVECHREGQVAPFALTSYDEVAGWGEMIREVIEEERMPPWHASAAHGKFLNEARLPDGERQLIYKWIENGLPEGDRGELPPPAEFQEGWRIPKPDLIVKMPEPCRIPASGTVDYKTFIIDPGFTKDMWVRGSEGKPGNRLVVHHIVLFYLPPGQKAPRPIDPLVNTVAGFAPGTPAHVAPVGYARRIPAGSKLVFQMHYTPCGTEQYDQSEAGLIFTDEREVEKELKIGATLNYKFRIPPGDDNYLVESQYRFSQDVNIYSLIPHMHLRGKSFAFEAAYPDGRSEVLLDVPRYDFNWQNIYLLAEPKHFPEGTVLKGIARFDNSEKNLKNPNPTEHVRFGEQTWEEMMVGMYYYSMAEQNLKLGPPRVVPLDDGRYDVSFRYKPASKPTAVYLAGQFNEWKPDGHRMAGPDENGFYTTTVAFNKGRHEYKFVIDGKIWKPDPGNREQTGEYHNSVVTVGQ